MAGLCYSSTRHKQSAMWLSNTKSWETLLKATTADSRADIVVHLPVLSLCTSRVSFETPDLEPGVMSKAFLEDRGYKRDQMMMASVAALRLSLCSVRVRKDSLIHGDAWQTHCGLLQDRAEQPVNS